MFFFPLLLMLLLLLDFLSLNYTLLIFVFYYTHYTGGGGGSILFAVLLLLLMLLMPSTSFFPTMNAGGREGSVPAVYTHTLHVKTLSLTMKKKKNGHRHCWRDASERSQLHDGKRRCSTTSSRYVMRNAVAIMFPRGDNVAPFLEHAAPAPAAFAEVAGGVYSPPFRLYESAGLS